MIERTAVRVILLDPNGRTLLFRNRRKGYWFTPGGGLDEGETLEQAARREVREESGLEIGPLSPPLRRETIEFEFEGEHILQHQTFFVAQAREGVSDFSGWTLIEQRAIAEARWWTQEELSQSEQRVFPEDLMQLIRLARLYQRLDADPLPHQHFVWCLQQGQPWHFWEGNNGDWMALVGQPGQGQLTGTCLWVEELQKLNATGAELPAFVHLPTRLSPGALSRVDANALMHLKQVKAGASDGQVRQAQLADASWLCEWLQDFFQEALPYLEPPVLSMAQVEQRIQSQQVYLYLREGQPLATASLLRESAESLWLGLVYTPPAHRGQGWAAALVRHLAQQVQGKDLLLYASRAQGLYRRLGFETVAEYETHSWPNLLQAM